MKKLFTLFLSFILLCFLNTLTFAQTCADGSAVVPVVLNLTGINTAAAIGDADNSSGTISFGSQFTVIGLAWDGVIINPNGGSWCSEAAINIAGVDLRPGIADGSNTCNNPYGSGGFLSYSAAGISDFPTNAVGNVVWEGFETYDDPGLGIDQTFGGGTITVYGCVGLQGLPIELVEFKGKVMKNYNLITWTTASEVDSRDHIIEMSINGRDNWKEVGRVAPAGNSLEANNYSLKDMDPRAITYYRLKEVSFDDKAQYSDIIVLERTRDEFGIANLYPIPAKDKLTAQFETLTTEKITLNVLDINGRILLSEIHTTVDGLNTVELNVSNLTTGIYFIAIENSTETIKQRFMKR